MNNMLVLKKYVIALPFNDQQNFRIINPHESVSRYFGKSSRKHWIPNYEVEGVMSLIVSGLKFLARIQLVFDNSVRTLALQVYKKDKSLFRKYQGKC